MKEIIIPKTEETIIKFISYDGEYPNLCRGTLIIEINGEIYNLRYVLCSDGSYDINTEDITTGKWKIKGYNLPKELKIYKKAIAKLVNKNVKHGCCGGCI